MKACLDACCINFKSFKIKNYGPGLHSTSTGSHLMVGHCFCLFYAATKLLYQFIKFTLNYAKKSGKVFKICRVIPDS